MKTPQVEALPGMTAMGLTPNAVVAPTAVKLIKTPLQPKTEKVLKAAILGVLKAASKDEFRPNINAVKVDFRDQLLILEATDGHRMHRAEVTIGYLVPRPSVVLTVDAAKFWATDVYRASADTDFSKNEYRDTSRIIQTEREGTGRMVDSRYLSEALDVCTKLSKVAGKKELDTAVWFTERQVHVMAKEECEFKFTAVISKMRGDV